MGRLLLGLLYNQSIDCSLRSSAKKNREIGHFLNEDVGVREVIFKRLKIFSACLLLMGMILNIQKRQVILQ